MCGIVGYAGRDAVAPFLIRGLRKLEYRGYDSRGIAVQSNGTTAIHKTSDLQAVLEPLVGSVGIGHTRWATTGEVNDTNAHPHYYKGVSIVHNGIINNYKDLKKELQGLGHEFYSETDSEVIAHMIAEWDIETTIEKLDNGFGAFLAMDDSDPDKMWAYSDGAPLLVSGNHIASDIHALSGYADQACRIIPKQILVIEVKMKIKDYITLRKTQLDWENPVMAFDIRTTNKGKFEHYMLKEIYEQPKCLTDMSGGVCPNYIQVSQPQRFVILACGSSYCAGLLLKQYLSRICGIEAVVEYASEFRNNDYDESQYYIAISQSGETKDVIESIKNLPNHRVITFHNTPHSTITNHAQHNNNIQAGLEIGVAATKTFTSTCLRMWHWVEWIQHECYYAQSSLIEAIESILDMSDSIYAIAQQIFQYNHFLVLGSGYHYPIALETALKLKEVAYVHAEAMPAAEMKHGPLALIDPNMPSIVFCMEGDSHEKIAHNIDEIKSRHGKTIVITNIDGVEADWIIKTPKVKEHLQPIVSVVVGQLLSYHIASLRCCEIDRPRNLAKSVTV